MKLLIILLLLSASVHGQEHIHTVFYTWPPKYSICPVSGCNWNELYHSKKNPIPRWTIVRTFDSLEFYQKEIAGLRQLNDSLQKKLNLLTEYYDYSCSILQHLDIVRRPGRKYIRYIDRAALIAAIERYYKRYKIK